MKKTPKFFLFSSLIVLGNLFVLWYALAWYPPTNNPPLDNLSSPLNASSDNQSKEGYLAIATSTAPSYPLDIAGSVNATAYYGDGSNLTGITSGLWTATSTGIYYNSGSVGIGTTSPGAKLDVAGHIWQTGTGHSVFLGEGAGANDDLSTNNSVFVGYYAGYSNTTGYNNTASGNSALRYNTTGSQNTASGGFALYNNREGNYNTASGYYALRSNTAGGNNTASGSYALYKNTGGNRNTASGYGTLYSNTTGGSNTASGYYSLYANTEGNYNTASGYFTLYSNTTGGSNTASGRSALYSNTTGDYNTASGYSTLSSNTTGWQNTASGYQALYSNTTGIRNSALGVNAGNYIADGTTANSTSTYSLYLGTTAKAKESGDTNEIVIGYNATGLGSNTVVLGNSDIVTTALRGNVGIGTTAPLSKLSLAASGDPNPNSGAERDYAGGGLTFMSSQGYLIGQIKAVQAADYWADTGDLVFRINNSGTISERMRITTAGNVGIGLTAPGQKLEVAGNIQVSGGDGKISLGAVTTVNSGLYFHTISDQNYYIGRDATTWGGGQPLIAASYAGWQFKTGSFDRVIIDKDGKVGIGLTGPTYQLQLSTDSAAKPTSNTWTIASDIRVKEDIEPFTDGLNVVNQLNPVSYKLNGKAGFIKGQAGISLIANNVKDIIPYAVSTYKAKLEPTDAQETELYDFNSSPLTFVTINAIKELNNKIEVLQSENEVLSKRIEILETR